MEQNVNKEQIEAIVFGSTKYLHQKDENYDYLIDDSNSKVKVNVRFTRCRKKNEIAKIGLGNFLTGISS